jgi:hypothetical protein
MLSRHVSNGNDSVWFYRASLNLQLAHPPEHLVISVYSTMYLLILQSFGWLAAFHLELLQAILFIAV